MQASAPMAFVWSAGRRAWFVSGTIMDPSVHLVTAEAMQHGYGNIVLAILSSGKVLDCSQYRKKHVPGLDI
jgi:hypothetical protein